MSASTKPVSTNSPEVQIRLLSFSTGDMLQQALSVAFAEAGFKAEVASAGFATVVPELLQPVSERSDAIVIQVDPKGLLKRDWRQSSEQAERQFEESTGTFLDALHRFAQMNSTEVLINSMPSPTAPSAGFMDPIHPDGAGYLIREFNRRLGETVRQCNNVTLIDADVALAHIAPIKRADAKLWYYGRIPYALEATRALANAFGQAYAARKSKPVKALALDLDNTLWRGIFGEDGLHGIECGDDFPGNAFKAIQEECLRLKSQGLLLTILSKNDEDVLEVFDVHPGMSLKRDDIVAHRINWDPKSQNIRALADELDIGLDSFLFLDDSPHERDAMRRLAPEVRVPELPDDPAVRVDFLRRLEALWPTRLTAEDRLRSAHYAARVKGRALRQSMSSVEEYLQSLGQRLCVETMKPETLPRVAQMHARTNQFNLTTLRLSDSDLAEMMADQRNYRVFVGHVSDRFGDHGAVICACVQVAGARAELKTFLMSCRVIGRRVEFAFLRALLEELTASGVEEVEGTFLPTKKNAPAREFFESAGFVIQQSHPSTAATGTKWLWRSNENSLPEADCIKVVRPEETTGARGRNGG